MSSHHHHHRSSSPPSNPYPYRAYSSRKSSTSAYRRSPRSGYIAALWHRIKRMLRDLYRYCRAHPLKILLPLVMALASGGALTALAAKVGLGEVARNIESLLGAGKGAKGGYDAWYGSQNLGGRAAGSGGAGWMNGLGGSGAGVLQGVVKVASAFL